MTEAIEFLMKGRTTIMIAQRLKTLEKCDKILFVEDGVVKEQGTYGELIALKGRFADYVTAQKSKTDKPADRESPETSPRPRRRPSRVSSGPVPRATSAGGLKTLMSLAGDPTATEEPFGRGRSPSAVSAGGLRSPSIELSVDGEVAAEWHAKMAADRFLRVLTEYRSGSGLISEDEISGCMRNLEKILQVSRPCRCAAELTSSPALGSAHLPVARLTRAHTPPIPSLRGRGLGQQTLGGPGRTACSRRQWGTGGHRLTKLEPINWPPQRPCCCNAGSIQRKRMSYTHLSLSKSVKMGNSAGAVAWGGRAELLALLRHPRLEHVKRADSGANAEHLDHHALLLGEL